MPPRWIAGLGALGLAIVAGGGRAEAQREQRDDGVDEAAPPEDEEVDEHEDERAARDPRRDDPVDEGYPALHTLRPLLLPRGGGELTARVLNDGARPGSGDGGYSVTTAEARLRAGLGFLEAEAAAQVVLAIDAPAALAPPERLRQIFVAARRGLGGDDGLAAELELHRSQGIPLGYDARLVYRRRDHLTRRGTLTTALGAGLWGTSRGGERVRVIDITGRIGVEAQVHDRVMVAMHGELVARRDLDTEDDAPVTLDGLSFAIGWSVTVAITRGLDAVVGARVDATGEVEAATVYAGLIVRRLP